METTGSGYAQVESYLQKNVHRWLVTGGAGFIGSHIVSRLLSLGQDVVVLDNLATGKSENIEHVLAELPADSTHAFSFVEGDIRDYELCEKVLEDRDLVSHQAALGSVPRSISNPIATNESNVTGFLNILSAAQKTDSLKAFVYASSSSVYGDSAKLPKYEHELGKVLSPYAASKIANEIYADSFASRVPFSIIGFRYFNVFGPRQDANGPYAAVIPRWIDALANGQPIQIYGDGETSRDFCYVENAVQANLLGAAGGVAGLSVRPETNAVAYNVAVGQQTTLNELATMLRDSFCQTTQTELSEIPDFIHKDFRDGDVRHSLADLHAIKSGILYEPSVTISEGITRTVEWFLRK